MVIPANACDKSWWPHPTNGPSFAFLQESDIFMSSMYKVLMFFAKIYNQIATNTSNVEQCRVDAIVVLLQININKSMQSTNASVRVIETVTCDENEYTGTSSDEHIIDPVTFCSVIKFIYIYIHMMFYNANHIDEIE